MSKFVYTVGGLILGFLICGPLASGGFDSDVGLIIIWAIPALLGFIIGYRIDKDDKNRHDYENNRGQRIYTMINEPKAEIERMMNSSEYKRLINDIWSYNVKLYSSIIERECRYDHKPEVRTDWLAYPRIRITNKYVDNNMSDYSDNSSRITFDSYGAKDLDNNQIQILGKAILHGKGYKCQPKADETGFSVLEADMSYWEPRMQSKVDEVYKRKQDEYNSTHKSFY